MPRTLDSRTLPDRVADRLIARILVGDLQPGDRLPPERDLALQLKVDRTSLRMALRQLVRMNLIKPLRGSGITVLDWRRHAGLDLLAAAFANPDIDLGAAFHLEALDHFITMISGSAGVALTRATSAELGQLDALLVQQLEAVKRRAPRAQLIEGELALQDAVTQLQGSTIASLVANATRPLRRRMLGLFLETVDMRQHIETMRRHLRLLMTSSPSAGMVTEGLRLDLLERTRALRERLAAEPLEPRLRSSASRAAREIAS